MSIYFQVVGAPELQDLLNDLSAATRAELGAAAHDKTSVAQVRVPVVIEIGSF